jgi:hypothetical protein
MRKHKHDKNKVTVIDEFKMENATFADGKVMTDGKIIKSHKEDKHDFKLAKKILRWDK